MLRLSKLFDDLKVETVQSDMSLSIAARGVKGLEDFEWSSKRHLEPPFTPVS